MSLTEPQSDLLRRMGLKLTGFDLHYVRGERGRTSIAIENQTDTKAIQPRTAEALLLQGYIETVARSDDDMREGQVFQICRLSPKGWTEIGIPVPEAACTKQVVSVADYFAKRNAPAPVVHADDACGQSERVKCTNKNRQRAAERKRRKQERQSRRLNRR